MGSYNYYKMFGCFNRKFKISESEPPPDVREAFWRFADGADHMSADQLHNFMVQHQRDEHCTAVARRGGNHAECLQPPPPPPPPPP
ncbi:hypothetical protein CASFOL_023565 [Castilleja foliolosa]|uniref:Uncharacterized protein n=1 Tax=Castilleja foliolosa TaxID=1961234 RepID=A0ABD3CNT4_9LAMI